MFDKLLPRTIDNSYRGYRAALWLFGLVVLVKAFQGAAVIFNGYTTLRDADGIPLDTYPHDAAQTVLALWALVGLERLIIALLCVIVLVRYRSLITFMFAVLAVDYLAKELILYFIPIVRAGTPPGPYINLAIFSLTIIGLVLSRFGMANSDEPR